MIFLKHFDTTRQTLYGVGKTYVQRNAKVSDLNGFINEKMRWPAGTPLKLYEVKSSYTYYICFRSDFNSWKKGNQTRHD